jgi:glycosyltransferase involved in cell wall biosynthesis
LFIGWQEQFNMKLSVVILTKNEEENIERCLKSVSFYDEIIVVDDYSTDNTKNQISKIKNQNYKLNIKIYERKLKNDFAGQRNFGLQKATNDWVLFIDADEELTKKLQDEVKSVIRNLIINNQYNSFYIRRRDFFWNQELKHGEISQIRQFGLIRLVRKDSGHWLGNVHEVFYTADRTGRLNGILNHYPHPTLKDFINDINYYSTIRAEELFNRGITTNIFQIIFFPSGKFLYNYFLKLGFLDGAAGFTYAFMMSFHSFLVRGKLYQLINK